MTDANVVPGYTGSSSVPGDELLFDVDAARDVLSGLVADVGSNDVLVTARGVYRVANVNMMRTIQAVTVERGRDPWRLGLVALGGAGPMYAAALAESPGIEIMAAPRAYGVLSAYGLLATGQKHDSVRTLHRPPSGLDVEAVESAYTDLETDTSDDVIDPGNTTVRCAADLRYVGQSFELTIPVGKTFDAEAVEAWFHGAHKSAYGHRSDDPVELVNVRVTAVVEYDPLSVTYHGGGDARKDTREAFFDGELRKTPVCDHGGLGARTTVKRPAIPEQRESTVIVPPTWGGTAGASGTLVLINGGDGERATARSTP